MKKLLLSGLLILSACNPVITPMGESKFDDNNTPFYYGLGPFEITSSSVGKRDLNLVWSSSKGAETYAVNYRLEGAESFTTVQSTSPHTLMNLIPGARYEVFIEASKLSERARTSTLTLTLQPLLIPVAHDLTPSDLIKNTPTVINLSYTDPEGGAATECSVSNLDNLDVTSPCVCVAGACSLEVRGTSTGPADFSYQITSNGLSSNSATVTTRVDGLELDGAAYRLAYSGILKTCKEYVDSTLYDSEGSGLYWIDPDGAGTNVPFKAYCEMNHNGGGWTLVANRRGNASNVDTCGTNLTEFFQSTCGTPENHGYTHSYNIGPTALRNSLLSQNEWLFLQFDSQGILDADEAHILTSNTDLFFSTTHVVNQTPIPKVCDYNNSNCDTTDVYFIWVGNAWFMNASCGAGIDYGPHTGNYGYCHNGLNNIDANSLFGNRSAYDETKLWNFDAGRAGQTYQEQIFVR